jgi:hypothetical protein
MATPESPTRQRHPLLDAVAAVAGAAGSPDPQPELSWALGHLAGAFQRHRAEADGADGLLTTVAADTPRLISAVEGLRREHHYISEGIRALRLRLNSDDGSNPGTREEVMPLLDSITAHHQEEMGLMLDAYNVDVEGGD